MPNHSDKKAADLSNTAIAEIENLLGRPLDPDERVSIRAYRTHSGLTGEDRVKAWKRLEQAMDRIAQKVRNVPPNELEDLLDEVCDEVRHGV